MVTDSGLHHQDETFSPGSSVFSGFRGSFGGGSAVVHSQDAVHQLHLHPLQVNPERL